MFLNDTATKTLVLCIIAQQLWLYCCETKQIHKSRDFGVCLKQVFAKSSARFTVELLCCAGLYGRRRRRMASVYHLSKLCSFTWLPGKSRQWSQLRAHDDMSHCRPSSTLLYARTLDNNNWSHSSATINLRSSGNR